MLSKNISPKSISVHYRDTIDIDPFGHDTISVVGPTILYKTDMQGEKNIITGYTPATITLHKQNIAKLTESQFEAKLQHTITHLKQAHTEQINLLSKAIGSERFAQYAQPYKQALEREADFLEPIKSAEVAKIVQHAFLDEAFDSAMKEVKVNREKHGLDNKETALIVCTPIEEGPAILSSIASFEDLATYLNNKKEEIYQQLATTQNGVDYNQIDNFKTAVNKDINYIKTVCDQTPLENIIHDTELSPFILEETKRLLKQAGINPNSVNIFSKTRLTQTNREKFIKLLKETNIPLPPEDEQGAIQWLESRLLRRNLGQLDTPASVTSPTLLEKNNLGETTGYIPAMIMRMMTDLTIKILNCLND